jgi:predicted regulator of Ras-like GTPase activity (Roadblock/LC7/MglB family)
MEGIDISAEETVCGVETRRAEKIERELSIENVDVYGPIVTRSLSDVEACLAGISDKRAVHQTWSAWKEQIDNLLIANEKITVEMLTGIPMRWRKWALTRYLSEHLGEALIIEAGTLTKIKVAAIEKRDIDLLLGDFLHSAHIDGVAALRRDGLVIGSKLPPGVDSNLIAAISAKLMANADMASLELERGRSRFVILKTAEGEAVIYGGKYAVLIALMPKGEMTGLIISSIERIAEKLDELIKR